MSRRLKRRKIAGFDGYLEKVLSVEPSSLIGCWLQNERSGTISYDSSGQGNNGAYIGVALGQAGVPGMGMTSPFYDGVNDVNNIHSAGFVADFDGREGAFLIWDRMANAGVWTDATTRRMFMLYVDDNNFITIEKRNIDNTLRFNYTAGGVAKILSLELRPTLDDVPYGITWSLSDDEVKFFNKGVQEGPTMTGLAAWVGALHANLTVIGATNKTPVNPFSGTIAPVISYDKALSYDQVACLSNHLPRPSVVISFDDGKVSTRTVAYPLMAARNIKGTAYVVSSTIGGGGIMTVGQLQELDAAGWDIANHTDTHADLTLLNQVQQEAEISACTTALNGWGLTRASNHVAYPGGAQNNTTLLAMAAQNMLSGRKVTASLLNPGTARYYKLPAQNTTLLAATIAQTQAALDGGQTFVYYAHDIGGGVDLSAADFETWLDWLIANSVEMLTISELYGRMS